MCSERLEQNSLPDLEKLDLENSKLESHDFPIELLELIFSFAIPPDGLLDPSLDSGYSKVWEHVQQDKLSFVLVNETWYHTAIQFLYRHIVIRHFFQITLLRRTMKETTALKNLPLSISLSCYIPPEFAESCNRDIQLLRSPSFNLHFPIWMPQFNHFLLSSPPLLTKLSMTMNIASYEHPSYFWNLCELVRHNAHCLRCLAISPPSNQSIFGVIPIDLPELEDLHLVSYERGYRMEPFQDFLVTWTLPKLKQFTFDETPIERALATPAALTLFGPFLKLNGPKLQILQIVGGWKGIRNSEHLTETLQTILDFCPHLNHLIIGADYGPHNAPVLLHHATLEYLDIWLNEGTIYPRGIIGQTYTPLPFTWDGQSYEPKRRSNIPSGANSTKSGYSNPPESSNVLDDVLTSSISHKSKFPMLRNIRRIHRDLSYLPNLPLILHPKWFGHPNDEWTLFSLPGWSIQVSAGAIFPIAILAPSEASTDGDSASISSDVSCFSDNHGAIDVSGDRPLYSDDSLSESWDAESASDADEL